MNIQGYHKQQIIGWLSYNPYFEARMDATDNRVCYFYPRFIINGGRYIPIDSKRDFPQVGRIAIRIQGQETAAEVCERFGSVVICRINTVPSPNYSANNHYSLRYNPQFGRDSSEIWIDRIDANVFYQIIAVNNTIEDVLRSPEIEYRYNSPALCSKAILLDCGNGHFYGPFEYTQRAGYLSLQAIERFDYMVGSYNVYGPNGLISDALTILDQSDQPMIDLMPVLRLPSPQGAEEHFDMIKQDDLVSTFLDQAKERLKFSRSEFRELKSYCEQIMSDKEAMNITEERFDRLKNLLPELFTNEEQYAKLIEMSVSNEELRKHIISDVLNTNANTLVHSLPESYVKELSSAVQSKVNEVIKSGKVPAPQAPAPAPAPAAPATPAATAKAKATSVVVDPATYEKTYGFLLNPEVKSNVEAIVNESEQLLSTLNIIYSNIAFLNDADSDFETMLENEEMNPENIKHDLDVASMLLGFIGNLHLIIDGALSADDKQGQKRYKDYKDLSSRLEQLHSDIELKCKQLKASTALKDFVDNYEGSAKERPAAAASAAVKPEAAADTKAKAKSAADAAAAAANSDKAQALEQNIQELSQELERYSEHESLLRSNIENLTKQLEKLQGNIAQKEEELSSIEEKISGQDKLAKDIMSKLQKSVSQYQDQASTAIHLLDSSIINSILGVNTELLGAFNVSGSTPAANKEEASSASNATAAAPATTSSAASAGFNVAMLAPESDVNSANRITERVLGYLNNVGKRNLSFNEVVNYLICISQGFITTIAGEPGTGKTSLCNLLAHALGLAPKENTRFIEVAVERGWTSLKDLIGYYNPLTKRMEKSNAEVFDAFSRLNLEAQSSPDGNAYDPKKIAPYLVLLDEANLSPIEHYWAAFFRNCDIDSNNHRSINLGGSATWLLPPHLRFLATVNFDHTTEELSSRFLDRSWVITLEPSSIQLEPPANLNDNEPAMVSFDSLQQAFNSFGAGDKLNSNLLEKWQNIQNIFASEQCALPIRPRNLTMVYRYCLAAQNSMQCNSESTKYAPLDYAVAQKILPTINGSGERYKQLVEELLKECNEQQMPLCAAHLKRIKRNGGADLGFYQFFAR